MHLFLSVLVIIFVSHKAQGSGILSSQEDRKAAYLSETQRQQTLVDELKHCIGLKEDGLSALEVERSRLQDEFRQKRAIDFLDSASPYVGIVSKLCDCGRIDPSNLENIASVHSIMRGEVCRGFVSPEYTAYITFSEMRGKLTQRTASLDDLGGVLIGWARESRAPKSNYYK